MRKVIASTTVAASLLGAGFGAVVLGPTLAGAQEETDADSETETAASPTGLDEVLDGLVTDGTLTQEQRDIVEERLREARPNRGHGPRGGHGFGRVLGGDVLGELGLDADTVRDGLTEGLTLGEIAEANGSSVEALTDALTEQAESRLDTAVENGRIDEDRAAELEAEIDERIEDLVNGEVDFGRHGGPKGRFGGPGAEAAEDLGA